MPNPASTGLPNPSSYDTSVAGIVTDRVTGLVWQRQASGSSYTLSQAVSYCDGLSLAGYTHWKVPTRVELVSILDFTRTGGPRIDPTAFPNTASVAFWASTRLTINGTAYAFSMDFLYGSVSYDGPEETFNSVRCVR